MFAELGDIGSNSLEISGTVPDLFTLSQVPEGPIVLEVGQMDINSS